MSSNPHEDLTFSCLIAGMKRSSLLIACCGLGAGSAAEFRITAYDGTNNLPGTSFSNASHGRKRAFRLGSVEAAAERLRTTGSVDHATLPVPSGIRFYRLLQSDISATGQGFTNFTECYGVMTTIAGTGIGGMDRQQLLAEFDGGAGPRMPPVPGRISHGGPRRKHLYRGQGQPSILKIYAGRTHSYGSGDAPGRIQRRWSGQGDQLAVVSAQRDSCERQRTILHSRYGEQKSPSRGHERNHDDTL